jgi:archaellum component FlaC
MTYETEETHEAREKFENQVFSLEKQIFGLGNALKDCKGEIKRLKETILGLKKINRDIKDGTFKRVPNKEYEKEVKQQILKDVLKIIEFEKVYPDYQGLPTAEALSHFKIKLKKQISKLEEEGK